MALSYKFISFFIALGMALSFGSICSGHGPVFPRVSCNQRSYLALPYDARINRLLNWIWDRLWRHEYLWFLFWRATPCIFQSWRCDFPPPKDLNLWVWGDVYLLAQHWANCWGASLLLGVQAPELKMWFSSAKGFESVVLWWCLSFSQTLG